MRVRAKLAFGLTAVLAVLVLAAAWLSWLGAGGDVRPGIAGQALAAILIALLACAACAWLLAGLLVRPIERLTRHVGVLSQRPKRLPVLLPRRDDEIGELARAFNKLLEELRQREAGLRLSEEKFFKAFHSNPDFTLITRFSDGRVVEANEGFEKLLGIPVAEAVGKMSIADLNMWADPGVRERFVQVLQKEGSVRDFPAVFIRRDGERREVEINATTIELAGEPHIIGTSHDVTELRRSQEELRRSEEKFAKAFYANPNYSTVSRLEDGRMVAVNRGFEQLTGWKAEEVLGRTALDIGLWADPAERDHLVEELRLHREWRGFRVHFRTKSGEIRLVEGSCVITEIGGEQQIIGVARDITEVARAEQALRQSEEKFSKIFHASPDGILIARLEDGLVLDLNESYERLLGWPRDECIGRTTVELGIWARPEMRGPFIEEVKRQGSVSGYEFVMRRRDGSLRDVVTSTVLIDIAGTPCLISIVRDISEQRHAEEEIRDLNVTLEHRVKERTSELEAAVRELESFSYSVSHDLRSPLRAIAGYAKVIEEDYAGQVGAEGRAQLERIVSNAIRMGEIIDDLLDFARIGRAELKRVPIDMAGLAREVLAEQPEAGVGRGIDVRIGGMPTAMADRSLVRQVWSNLLSNALKYTRQRQQAVIEAGGTMEGGEAHYFVRDNGAGFDMAYASKLFHVFQRLHRDSAFEGTGVGLAIVARIVQRHGGRVWAEGAPEQGATFHFTLPAASR
jgi:PAS domain S-box-containing protein